MISISLLLLGLPGINIELDICNYYNISKEIISPIGVILFYLSFILTIVSGWQYFNVAWPILTEKTKNN
jgi:phosphatidylglycerophosphate synthase